MFKVGEKKSFSFGRFTIEKEFETNFKYIEKYPTSVVSYTIAKVYLLTGRGDAFLGISNKGHILKLPNKIALENIR